ncbi:MAG TPA: nitroreductase family protein [Chitinophaga sp.]|jgi:nitroreductase|uniref:nitroreductase family protein n=1 Tax=Chitinophaga sp. TaxID=1869181 RepID=UPI002DB6B2F8|nr:nitroreductase family protein [Chitinophaga sp.]HEU4552346.1 nitroreductase family protein [Chitinophaga sp.]
MNNAIATTQPVHPLLLQRWSPKSFQDRPVPAATLNALFEAARLAPSCFNEQPWHFIAGTKDNPAQYEKILRCFTPDNQAWARTAPVLIIAVVKLYFQHNGAPNVFAWHDLGLAVANLTFQAVHEGLQVCEAAGIDHERLYTEFAIPEGYQPCTGLALGYAGNGANLTPGLQQKHNRERTRKPVQSFVHYGMPALEMTLDAQQKQVYELMKEKFAFGDLRPVFAFARQRMEKAAGVKA